MENMLVATGNQVFHKSVGIPMGTKCVPLLTDLISYSYEAKLLHEKNNFIALTEI
jgi:hypothetical protein